MIGSRTRRFARWSAIGALGLGVTGQIAYHLLAEFHVTRAPWPVTTLVASLPVVVLGTYRVLRQSSFIGVDLAFRAR